MNGRVLWANLILLFFLINLTANSLGQTQPVFKQQDFPSHGDTIILRGVIPNVIGLSLSEAKIIFKKNKIKIGDFQKD